MNEVERRDAMSKIAIVVDSNSGYTQESADAAGIYLIPMPFYINEEEYFEGVNLTQKEFYEFLKQDANVTTSQPSPDSMLKLWDELLKDHEEIIYFPMSSGLSGTCQTAMMLAQDYEGRVLVVDNQRISVPLKHSIMDACTMAEYGRTGKEIKEYLEKTKMDSAVYITVDTLKYLKKGGRITPAAAALGTLLKIKPVLQIRGEKLDSYAKARTMNQAKKIMIDALKKDVEDLFDGNAQEVHFDIAHTQNEKEAMAVKSLIESAFPGCEVSIVDPLSLSIACHIGEGAVGVAWTRKLIV
jgi:DegV family protein with EDD domain